MIRDLFGFEENRLVVISFHYVQANCTKVQRIFLPAERIGEEGIIKQECRDSF